VTEFDFKRTTSGVQQRTFEAPSDHTSTGKQPRPTTDLDVLGAPVPSIRYPGLDDVLPAALPSTPEPYRPTNNARFKIVCSYQNFFEQKSSSSSSRVVFLKGQDLEFRIVDTKRGDADDFLTENWVWSLVRIVSARRQERQEKSTILGSGTYLRTNDLFLGEWRLIAKHRLRRESCSIVLVGRSVNDWSIFKGIMPKARLDPDGYLERLSTCLRVNSLGNTCDEAADPTDGRELPTFGATSWDVHEHLEKRLAKTKGLPRIPMQALYTSLETGKNYALRVFLAIVDGKWLLTDWSCPTAPGMTGWFEGGTFVGEEGDREGILKAIKAWEDGNRYGFGSIHWRVLVPTLAFELKGGFTTTGKTDLDVVSEVMQYLGTAGMAVGLSKSPLGQAGRVVANLSFAVSSGTNIYQKWSQGFNSFSDWMENGLDLLVLALTLAGLKKEASEVFAKAGVKNAEALSGAAQEVVVAGKKWTAMAKFEVGAGLGMMAVCHLTAWRTVSDIQQRKDLTPAQKVDLLVDALELLVVQDLILIVSHTKAAFNGAKSESSGKPGEEAPKIVRNLDELPGTTDGNRHETKVGRRKSPQQKEAKDQPLQVKDETYFPEHERIFLENRNRLEQNRYALEDLPPDLEMDAKGYFGFMPKKGSQFSSEKWAGADWGDPLFVAKSQAKRLDYYDHLAEKRRICQELQNKGWKTEQLARKFSAERNQTRCNAYDEKMLKVLKNRNAKMYEGTEAGPSYEYLLKKYGGSHEEALEAAFRKNHSMDLLVGIAKRVGNE